MSQRPAIAPLRRSAAAAREDPGSIRSAARALIAVAIGLLAGGLVAVLASPELAPMVAVIAATVVLLIRAYVYLAFTVGMAFAAPEVQPTSTAARKVVLGHALLSYLLGAGILAVAVNLVTNLGRSSG